MVSIHRVSVIAYLIIRVIYFTFRFMREADTRSTCYSSFSMRILLVVTIKKRIPHVGSILNCLYCRCLQLSFSRGIRGLGQRLRAKGDLN